MAVSRILSGEVDKYDTSIESAPVTLKNDTTIKTEVKTEELHIPSLPSSGAAVNYNNCTVNVFGSGNAPYPQPFPLPPYYYYGQPGPGQFNF